VDKGKFREDSKKRINDAGANKTLGGLRTKVKDSVRGEKDLPKMTAPEKKREMLLRKSQSKRRVIYPTSRGRSIRGGTVGTQNAILGSETND